MDPSHLFGSCIVLLTLTGSCCGDGFKRWVPNTNYETAANWEGGNVPCANDHIKFPTTLGAVFVQTNTTVTEMSLPKTGELLLGNYISISFPLEPVYTPGCPVGREVKFTRTDPKSWFDPSDWCVTAAEGGDCQADQPALLTSEQVPCNSDTVSFPLSSSFLVNLEYGTDVYTGTLIIGGKSYTTASFKAFLESEEGKRQFVRGSGNPATTVTVTGNQCTDVSGCACGNDRGSILEKICQSASGQCGATLTCTQPITPMGACCQICGAVMKLDITPGFNKKDTENMILSKYVHGQDKYKDVKPIMSKTSLGQIQIVLTDAGDGQLSEEVAFALKTDFEGNPSYGVTSVSVDVSETVKPTAPAQTGNAGSIVGIIVGLLLAAFIAGILYFVVVKNKRPTLPFNVNLDLIRTTFANLRKPRAQSDLELGTVVGFSPGVQELYGFDNPMYDDAGSAKNVSETPTPGPVPTKLEPVSDTTAGFSNPLFGSGVQDMTETLVPGPVPSKPAPESDTTAGFSNPLYGSGVQVDLTNLGEGKPEMKESAKINKPDHKKSDKNKKSESKKSVKHSKSEAKKSDKRNTPVEELNFPDATGAGFSNPVYSATPLQVVNNSAVPDVPESPVPATTVDTSDSAILVLNSELSTGDVEDSFI